MLYIAFGKIQERFELMTTFNSAVIWYFFYTFNNFLMNLFCFIKFRVIPEEEMQWIQIAELDMNQLTPITQKAMTRI